MGYFRLYFGQHSFIALKKPWKIFEGIYQILYNLFLMLVVGCAHRRLSRPYTIGGDTYCICRGCGAYRRYDLERMRPYGTYFFQFSKAAPVSAGLRADGAAEAGGLLLPRPSLVGQLKQPA